jgi:hypothetical protein
MVSVVGRERGGARSATRAWLDILRGAWMVLPAAPAPSEVVAMVREKGGQEEEELAWLEALAGCLGAAVALAREQHGVAVQVGVEMVWSHRYQVAGSLDRVEGLAAGPCAQGCSSSVTRPRM